MSIEVIGAIAAIVAIFSALTGWVFSRMKEATGTVEKLMDTKFSSVGRTLDELKVRMDEMEKEVSRHDRRIVQSDVVLVHIDESIKKLSHVVEKLDDTLRLLQMTVNDKSK